MTEEKTKIIRPEEFFLVQCSSDNVGPTGLSAHLLLRRPDIDSVKDVIDFLYGKGVYSDDCFLRGLFTSSEPDKPYEYAIGLIGVSEDVDKIRGVYADLSARVDGPRTKLYSNGRLKFDVRDNSGRNPFYVAYDSFVNYRFLLNPSQSLASKWFRGRRAPIDLSLMLKSSFDRKNRGIVDIAANK